MKEDKKDPNWKFGKDSPRNQEQTEGIPLIPEAIQAPAPEPYVALVPKPSAQTYDPSPAKPPVKSGHVTSEDILHPKHSTPHKHATPDSKKSSR